MNNYNTVHQNDLLDQSAFFGDHTLHENEVWNKAKDAEQERPMETEPHSERGIAGFVSKLYQCLQSNDSNPKYVRWCKHNDKDMFVIDCIPEFTEAVLPRLFKHCKFPSFVRQLNIYGFQRDTDARKTKDTKNKVSCRWYHPYFKPNGRGLFHLIRRKATRYSRKKRVKLTSEEDPETILSADEDEDITSVKEEEDDEQDDISNEDLFQGTILSDLEPSNNNSNVSYQPTDQIVLLQQQSKDMLLFQHQQHENDLHTIAGINEPLQTTTTTTTTTTTKTTTNDSYSIKQQDPYLRIQQLELQLFQLKLKYDKMEGYLAEELNKAKLQMKEYQHHIHQLECALGITKAQTNGYIYPYSYNNMMYIPQQNNIMYHKVKPEQNPTAGSSSSSSSNTFQPHPIDFNMNFH